MSFLSELLGEAYKENMTEEEISNALKGLSALNGEQEKETNKLKNLLSDRNGEIAKLKGLLKEKQTDDEIKALSQRLKDNYPNTQFYTSHCTGDGVFQLMQRVMGEQLQSFSCGTMIG